MRCGASPTAKAKEERTTGPARVEKAGTAGTMAEDIEQIRKVAAKEASP